MAAAIVLAGFGLRVWGITWALPSQDRYFTYHPDEGVNLINGVLENGQLRPHLDLKFYNYGALYFYLWQGAASVNRAYGVISLPPTDPPRTPSPESPASLILVGRIVSAVMGGLTVWAVYLLGRRLYGEGTGLLAALTFALIPVSVIHSHFATVDAPATFFATAALVLGARLLRSDAIRDSLYAGAVCGLAAAAKYNAGLVLAAPLVAIALRSGAKTTKLSQTAIMLIAAAAVFLVACPGPLIDPAKFWADFTYELEKSRAGMGLLFTDTGSGWIYHLTSSMRYGLGVPLLLLALAGVGYALWKRTPQDLYLLSFFALYYLVIGAAQVRFMRYIIPLCPVLAVLIGRLFWGEWILTPRWKIVARAAAAICLMMTLGISAAFARIMTITDVRDEALAFIRARIPPGQVIAFARTPWYDVPPLSPAFTAPSPLVRRDSALSQGVYAIRLPHEDRELDMSVFRPTPPDAVILSDIESQDWERLHIPDWSSYKEALAPYTAHVFENLPAIAGFSFGKPVHTPNDLLYIYPRVTVYTRLP